MSYLHCPTCRCAYNIATQPRCPRCPAQLEGAEAIVAALDQLARALTNASPAEMARVHARLAERTPVVEPEPALAIVPRPRVEHRLVDATRRLRSWTKARLAAPMQRARELLRAA